MKRTIYLLAGTSALLVLAIPAVAENAATPSTKSGMTQERSTEPDNTARNTRDRDNKSLTPMDQGNGRADLDISAQIRKEIMASDHLSMTAKNVKIITRDAHVTLRGPINSADEKQRIGEIAGHVAGNGNVDNQLEVKSTSITSQ